MRILLATDGSDYSREATRACRDLLANVKKAHVKVVTVIDNFTPMATEPFVTSEEFLVNMESEMRENAEGIVANAEKTLRDRENPPDVETGILLGLPKKMIIGEAEKWQPDMIIMGSHGLGFWGRAFIGSVSSAIVHRAPCSVLVVKKRDENASAG